MSQLPGTPSAESPEHLVTVGRCLKPHGVRGEVKVAILTDFPERFEDARRLHLHDGRQARELVVEGARFHKNAVLLKFHGVDSMTDAEKLKNMLVAVPESELCELEEDEYWHFQLEGLEVEDEQGNHVGRLAQVLENPGHDLYLVKGPRGEVLVPAVSEYVLDIDLEAGRVRVRLPQF